MYNLEYQYHHQKQANKTVQHPPMKEKRGKEKKLGIDEENEKGKRNRNLQVKIIKLNFFPNLIFVVFEQKF